MVQRTLARCFILVQIYFKLAKELLLPPDNNFFLFFFIRTVSTSNWVRAKGGQVYEILPGLGSRLVMKEVA